MNGSRVTTVTIKFTALKASVNTSSRFISSNVAMSQNSMKYQNSGRESQRFDVTYLPKQVRMAVPKSMEVPQCRLGQHAALRHRARIPDEEQQQRRDDGADSGVRGAHDLAAIRQNVGVDQADGE